MASTYEFDRFLRYDELVTWLHQMQREHPDLIALETYGYSYEGRDLWLVTVTDTTSGSHDHKPAHWVDASVHATELTACVAACYLIHHLVTEHAAGNERIRRALATRTFYIVPRVNPDGSEWALADQPRFRRSSTRAWPWKRDPRSWPGNDRSDVDGDGRILQLRIADPTGAWMPDPDDERLMVAVPNEGCVADTPRYRLLDEGRVHLTDGFTIGDNPPPEGLDLNRNFPSKWSTATTGSGDHPLSEPEIDGLVRAITARPNICGYNAMHTYGGVLLRPSSTQPDRDLDQFDLWLWEELGKMGSAATGYSVHSVYEDFTLDKSSPMSGAADDWVYDHLGIIGWTTEFWDVVQRATGNKQSTHFWYTGPTDQEALAVLRWCDENHPAGFVDWYQFDHPDLGPVELGGWNSLTVWGNPPSHLLRAEVEPHADWAVHQALCAPELQIASAIVTRLGPRSWRVEIGIANVGFLPTTVTKAAEKQNRVLPIVAELSGADVIGGDARQRHGQLAGRSAMRWNRGNDRTPDRCLAAWTVEADEGAEVTVTVRHQRAGAVAVALVLADSHNT